MLASEMPTKMISFSYLFFFFSKQLHHMSVSVEDDVTFGRDIGDLDLICMLTFLLSINNCMRVSG